MNTTSVKYVLFIIAFFCVSLSHSQREAEQWKAQFSLGLNSPFQSNFIEGFSAESINGPTVNMGIQHFFSKQLGFKLDYGFNRLSKSGNTSAFKINYSRADAQLVVDLSPWIPFLNDRTKLISHAGFGYSWSIPLADKVNNKLSYPNGILGTEFHYYLTKLTSLYFDFNYIKGLTSNDLSKMNNGGLAAFNGDMITMTVGLTFSLSGCYNCN